MININDFQAVLFDLDGTIIDPKEGIVNSILYAVKEFGLVEDYPETLDSFIGPPLQHSFQKRYHLTEDDAKEMVRLYRIYYADKGIVQCHLYPGIKEMMEELFERHVFLSLATSKPVIYADKLLRHFDLESYFDFTAGANTDGTRVEKKEVIAYALENIPPFNEEEILMIGDREFDIDGGNHFDLATAYARWGYGVDEVVMKYNPDYVFNQPSDIFVAGD